MDETDGANGIDVNRSLAKGGMWVFFVIFLFLQNCLSLKIFLNRKDNQMHVHPSRIQHAFPSFPLLTPPTPRIHKSIKNNYENFGSQEKVTLRKKSTRMNRRSSKKTTKLQNTY